jgi:hypothetical protein
MEPEFEKTADSVRSRIEDRSTSSTTVVRTLGWWAVLFSSCLVLGLAVRGPALSFAYFCWDEHDYIAHNIYARESLGHFEIPYSNKWPLGHAMVYLLTRPFSPFSIAPYRVAMVAIDAASAALVGLWIGGNRFGARLGISSLYLLVSSVCLHLSPGIIAENMANLPLIAAVFVLASARRSFVAYSLSIFCLALACLVKPTAALPGLGLICVSLWCRTVDSRARLSSEIFQVAVWAFVFAALIVGLYWLNAWNAQQYFWRSAVLSNTSAMIFGARRLSDCADLLFTAFAFFQYLTPALALGFVAIVQARRRQLNRDQACIFWPAIGMVLGALASLLIRPAGGQTTYWLYLLPPLFSLAIVGYQSLSARAGREMWLTIIALSIAPLIYAWALFIYGQPKGVTFGGHGGVRVVQTQVEQILPTVAALTSHPSYKAEHSRVFMWDRQWQIFYFARAIPVSSILTDETWIYLIDRQWQERELRGTLETSPDFVVTGKFDIPNWLESALVQDFTIIFNGEYQNIYARLPGNPR